MKTFKQLIVSTLIFWVLISCQTTEVLSQKTKAPLSDQVTHGRLSNGMEYYILPNQKPLNRGVFWLAIKAGSLQEEDDERGLAHFLEHLAFNGTRNFARGDLVKYFESIGMAFGDKLNAFTSFGETVYQLEIPMDDPKILQTTFQILEDWARFITIDPVELEKEKGVVQEEWRLSQGVRSREQDFLLPLMFNGSPHSDRLPIGSMNIVMNSRDQDLKSFYSKWYHPENMAILAVGDFDASQIEELIQSRFAWQEEKGPPHEIVKVPPYPNRSVYQFSDPELTMDLLRIVTVMNPPEAPYEVNLRRELLETLASGVLNFRLDQASKAPEPPFLGAYVNYSSLVRHNWARFEAVAPIGQDFKGALEAYLTTIEEARQAGVADSEFQRERTSLLHSLDEYLAQKDSRESRDLVGQLLDYYLEDAPFIDALDYVAQARAILDSLNLEDLNSFLAGQFTHTRSRVLVSMVEGKEANAELELSLEEVFDKVKAQTFKARIANTGPITLMDAPPSGGRIVQESFEADLGTTLWVLDNGARVSIKPTQFKKSEILIRGLSPGGLSTVDDKRVLALEFAPDLLLDGGVGDRTGEDVRRILASKLTSLQIQFSAQREEIHVVTNPSELEHALQLIYLSSQVRRDTPAFNSAKTRLVAWQANKNKDPFQALRDELRRVTFGGNPRGKPVSPEDLAQIVEEDSYSLFMDKVSNAADWSFSLVGDFDLKTLRPLVETYLGSLPTRNFQEKSVDRSIRPLKGPLELKVLKGLEPKTFVVLYDWISRPFSIDLSLRTEALESIVTQRVRDRVREELGGTYDINFSLYPEKYPFEFVQMIISFGCEPHREEELIQAVKAEINLLLKEGFTQEDITKFQTLKSRSLEVDRKNNSWWAQRLLTYPYLGLNTTELTTLDERIKGITMDHLSQLAQVVLNTSRWTRISLRQQK